MGDLFRCPCCSSDMTRQGVVHVYSRKEDSRRTLVTTVLETGEARHTILPSDKSDNPSFRRNGLAVEFWCEGCGEKYEFTLAQDKGQTFLGYRYAKKRKAK